MEVFPIKDYVEFVPENENDERVQGLIKLKKTGDIEKLFALINDEQNFILKFENDDSEKESVLIIGTSVSSKVKNGEIKLISIEEEE